MMRDSISPEEELLAAVFREERPSEAGFAEIFERDFKPKLLADIRERRKIADIRRRKKKSARWPLLFFAAAFIASLIGALLDNEGARPVLYLGCGMAAAFASIALVFWMFYPGMGTGSVWRKDVVEKALATYGLRFAENESVPLDLLRASPAWPAAGDETVSGLRVFGDFHGAKLDCWRIIRYSRVKNGDDVGEIVNYFSGWFLHLVLPYDLVGRTFIAQKQASYFGGRATEGLETASLESSEFNDIFSVFTNDQMGARMFLTPDVMEHMMAVVKGTKAEASLVISAQQRVIDIAIPRAGDVALLRWTPHRPAVAIREIHGYFEEMDFLLRFLGGIDAITDSKRKKA